jgi:hypothetical protein
LQSWAASVLLCAIHRGRLAAARDAEERLEAVAVVQALGQLLQGLRLIRDRAVRGVDLELRHALG